MTPLLEIIRQNIQYAYPLFQWTDFLSSTFYTNKVNSLIIGRSEVDFFKKTLSEKANSDLVLFEADKSYVLISNVYNNQDGYYLVL